MKCVIIDDDSTIRLQIIEFCKIIGTVEIVADFSDAMQAIPFLRSNKVDLLFLDVNLPHLSGIDFINNYQLGLLRIIMISSDANHAATIFGDSHIVDYLTKPIAFKRFVLSINNYLTRVKSEEESKEQKEEKSLFVNVGKKLVNLQYDEIYYIEANGDYVNFYLEKKLICVYSTLKNVKDKIKEANFLQVHRSYIVNINKIEELEDTSILIMKKSIPVSRTNKLILLKKLNLL